MTRLQFRCRHALSAVAGRKFVTGTSIALRVSCRIRLQTHLHQSVPLRLMIFLLEELRRELLRPSLCSVGEPALLLGWLGHRLFPRYTTAPKCIHDGCRRTRMRLRAPARRSPALWPCSALWSPSLRAPSASWAAAVSQPSGIPKYRTWMLHSGLGISYAGSFMPSVCGKSAEIACERNLSRF